MIFKSDFTSGKRDDGIVLKFTRLERQALMFFNENAGRILTRNQILDAVSAPGSEKSDRSVDFLMNRIRVKLGDSAQDPRFIETLYGEGYVWLKPTLRPAVAYDDAFIVIGPFRSTDNLGAQADRAFEIAHLLKRDLRSDLREDQRIIIAPDILAAQMKNGPVISIQLGFFRDHNLLECVVTARHCPNDRLVYVSRFSLEDTASQPLAINSKTQRIAEEVLTNHWQNLTAGSAADTPLPVAMHNAAQMPNSSNSWKDNDRRLLALRASVSDDPALKLMWATHLHSKYVYKGSELFRIDTATCAQDEAEIERLVLESLDFVQARPEYTAMAAKLLYFVDRGYKELALELANMALWSNTALTSSLAIVGQLHGFTDNMDAAECYLTQAVEMSDESSELQVYSLFMLCQAYMAMGDRSKLAATLKRIYKLRPASIVVFEPLFTDPVSPSLRAKAMMLLMKRDQAMGILRQVNYLSARLYENPKHRENALLTPANLIVSRFGRRSIPDDIAVHLPNLTS
jgi:tetratricopeptide (TPR) repeat protein